MRIDYEQCRLVFDAGSLASKSRFFELSFRCRRFLFERFFLLEFCAFNNSVLLASTGIVVHLSRRNLVLFNFESKENSPHCSVCVFFIFLSAIDLVEIFSRHLHCLKFLQDQSAVLNIRNYFGRKKRKKNQQQQQ